MKTKNSLHFRVQTSTKQFETANKHGILETRKEVSSLCHSNQNLVELLSFSMMALKISLRKRHLNSLDNNLSN
jgi:hypothetical protein